MTMTRAADAIAGRTGDRSRGVADGGAIDLVVFAIAQLAEQR